ncbi:MAG: hypothetical protein EYC70_16515 [Planctomycetota bacterium]|nr:MAG: hypothetical protein EYC70_16515 [Planctomycetota bacterium]
MIVDPPFRLRSPTWARPVATLRLGNPFRAAAHCSLLPRGPDSGMEFPRALVVLDTETTGAPAGARLLEIGAIKVRGRNVVGRYETLLYPECPIPSKVTAVHGIADADVAAAPTAAEVLPEFLEWTEGLPILAHNAPFDAAMLASECARLGLPLPDNPMYCTLQGARRLWRLPSYSLESLVSELGLPTGRHHRATEDAQHALHVYWRLREGSPHPPPRCLLGPGLPVLRFAPERPRLPNSRRFLLDAAQRRDAVDLSYLLPDGRVAQLRVTPRFFYRRGSLTMMEGLCHDVLFYKSYRLDRVLAARVQRDAPPVEVRRNGWRGRASAE